MKKRSIGFRLAAWYFLVLGSGLAAFSVVAWYAARASIDHAIDDELRDRVRGVAKSDAFRRSILLWIGPDQLTLFPQAGLVCSPELIEDLRNIGSRNSNSRVRYQNERGLLVLPKIHSYRTPSWCVLHGVVDEDQQGAT